MNERLSGYMLYLTALKIELMEKPVRMTLMVTLWMNVRMIC